MRHDWTDKPAKVPADASSDPMSDESANSFSGMSSVTEVHWAFDSIFNSAFDP